MPISMDLRFSVHSGCTTGVFVYSIDFPNKEQGWQDLHRLTQDEDLTVQRHAVNALGSAFPLAPDIKKGQFVSY
jgi:hypothetical protein